MKVMVMMKIAVKVLRSNVVAEVAVRTALGMAVTKEKDGCFLYGLCFFLVGSATQVYNRQQPPQEALFCLFFDTLA